MSKYKYRLKLFFLLSMIYFLVITSCLPATPKDTASLTTPFATMTPQAILSPTSIPNTPTPSIPRVEQKCAQFVEDSPSSFLDGTIVLRRFKQGEESSPIYFLDLKTNNQVALSRGIDATISPDGNKVAYGDVDLNIVVVADITGILVQIPSDLEESLNPAGWLDNQRLMLDKYEFDSNMKFTSISLVSLDVVTGDKEEWFQEYPNFSPRFYNRITWLPDTDLIINPKFKYLIYPSWEDSLPVILWDIDSNREVARIHNGDRESTPKWSPDGTRFVIGAPPQITGYKNIDDGLPNKIGNDLFLVSYTGKVERLTYFTVEEKSWQSLYSWSPDGQYIAFLLETGDFGNIDSGDLAIVNVKTGEVTQYCIGGIPIWTSDGRYILLSQTDDNFKSSVYLLDLQSSDTFLIAEDAYAIGGTIRNP